MRWAVRRQLFFAIIIAMFIGAVVALFWYVFLYAPASCMDGIQNQDERGVDCGGLCIDLCEAPRVSALWSRAVQIAPGVYHAVAMVRNPEPDAGTERLPYIFSIFDSENILIATREGVMRLDPGEIVPLFEPNILTGERVPTRSFITLGNAEWRKLDRVDIPIRVVSQSLDVESLRLSALIENTSPLPVHDIAVTSLLYDADGTLVTTSQTTVDTLGPRERREITMTWQLPFAPEVVKTDVVVRLR